MVRTLSVMTGKEVWTSMGLPEWTLRLSQSRPHPQAADGRGSVHCPEATSRPQDTNPGCQGWGCREGLLDSGSSGYRSWMGPCTPTPRLSSLYPGTRGSLAVTPPPSQHNVQTGTMKPASLPPGLPSALLSRASSPQAVPSSGNTPPSPNLTPIPKLY